MATARHALIMAMAASTLTAACGEQPASDPDRKVRKGWFFVKEEVTQEGGFFYRLEAHYTVKATGEPIDFDIVVACNIRTTNYTYTGPSFVAERYPEVMAKATKDGHAVMIKTPRVCQQIELDRGYVPEDFVPFTIWFDDVNDLSFGWGYATQDAYDGPSAKIAYRPTDPEKGTYTAKITRVSRAEWEAWRKKAAEDWVQIGALPGPWGYSDPKDKAGIAEEDRVRALNGGKGLGQNCEGISRIRVENDILALFKDAAKSDPNAIETDRFYVIDGSPQLIAAEHDVAIRARKEPIFGGYKWSGLWPVEGTRLKPPAFGSKLKAASSFRDPGYLEYYPLIAYIETPYLDADNAGYVRQILFGPRWIGLVACGLKSANETSIAGGEGVSHEMTIDLAGRKPIYLNNELLFSDAKSIPRILSSHFPRLVEKSGYLWNHESNPGS